jgi:peptidoglycan/LPS O-acetylase OafA/YrhL
VTAGILDFFFAPSIAKLGISPINDHMRIAFMYSAAPSQWVFFILGAALWIYQDILKKIPAGVWLMTGCAILWTPNFWALGLHLSPSLASGLGLAALLTGTLQSAHSLNSKLLLPLHWIGDWSFPLYLLHVPVMLIMSQNFQLNGYLALMLTLLISIFFSAVIHFAIEQPFRRLYR